MSACLCVSQELQASAHCLRLDELWYNIYAIGLAQIDYAIDVGVFVRAGPNDTAVIPDASCAGAPAAPAGKNKLSYLFYHIHTHTHKHKHISTL
jgi:hypothetical protein